MVDNLEVGIIVLWWFPVHGLSAYTARSQALPVFDELA